MRKFRADKIYTMANGTIQNGIVVTDDSGKILEVGRQGAISDDGAQNIEGVLIPGFINTHCHLELSHMLGKVDTGTGLIPFISAVVKFRQEDPEVINEAIRKAEDQMLEEGIVAVGDISNSADTFSQKSEGRIRYYTFLEMFDFHQGNEWEVYFNRYMEVYDQLVPVNGSRKSVVPHSPYTVSPELFDRLRDFHPENDATISIHNQEMVHENTLFQNGTGGLIDFFGQFGFSMDHFEPLGTGSIDYALRHMNPRHRNLFVHNTLTTSHEIEMAHNWSDKVYWATCANANLYIENRLPDYQAFMDQSAKMTIGTDSLTSNWRLSILDEIKAIAKYQSYVPNEELLKWATINGAQALGFDDTLGSIEVGKTPGVLQLSGDPVVDGWSEIEVRRII